MSERETFQKRPRMGIYDGGVRKTGGDEFVEKQAKFAGPAHMAASRVKCPLFSENPLFLGTFRERLEEGWSDQGLTILKKKFDPQSCQKRHFPGGQDRENVENRVAEYFFAKDRENRFDRNLIPYKSVRELHVGY